MTLNSNTSTFTRIKSSSSFILPVKISQEKNMIGKKNPDGNLFYILSVFDENIAIKIICNNILFEINRKQESGKIKTQLDIF